MLLKRGAGSGEPPGGGGVPYESGGDAGRLA